MPRFMDFHEDLKLPDDDIAQIGDDARHERADQFGVRQVELSHNPDGKVYCLLEAPDEEAAASSPANASATCWRPPGSRASPGGAVPSPGRRGMANGPGGASAVPCA